MKTIVGLIICVCATFCHAGDYLIHAGTMVDVINGKTLSQQSITVEKNRITKIESGYISAKPGQTLINLKDHTVMPGLMDMHVHLSSEYSKRSVLEKFQLNIADRAYRSVGYAEKTLMAGFTTVRDLGDSGNITISLRKAINRGLLQGPRIYAAGKSIGSTGSHMDPTNGFRAELMGDPGPDRGVINSPYDARKAVRQRYKNGSDVIKIASTGGVLSVAKSGENPQLMDDELEEIVKTAKDYNFVVAVHAHGNEGIKRAVKAGVDSVEHGTFLDDKAMQLMKKHGTYLVPTMLAGDWVKGKAKEKGFFPEIIRPKAAKIGPVIKGTVAKAYKKGVKMAYGTDSGVSPHGENAKEFVLMVEAGVDPMYALQSATINSARLLKIEDELGSLQKGMLADIVAVKGDPLEDMSLMQKVHFVMKDGVVYKNI